MSLLDDLRAAGAISPLDLHFARALGRVAGVEDDEVLAAAALANRAPGAGHVGAELAGMRALLEREVGEEVEDRPALPQLPEGWAARVAAATAVVRVAGEDRDTALVLDAGALYLDRYWRYEDQLAEQLRARMARPIGLPPDLDGLLDAHFDADDPRVAGQRRAARLAATNRFTVISGGPGTGKTSVVVKVIQVLQQLAAQAGESAPRVQMVAPTGKAANRLSESVRGTLPLTASTIHRALGVIRIEIPRFRHHRDNPLPVDILVVDEASMVDLPLMAKLVDAVPDDARLILLGDPDQLRSVELGAVLGDICSAAPATTHVHLEHTFRYRPDSGIRALAEAIRDRDGARAAALLDDPGYPDITRLEPSDLGSVLRPMVVPAYRDAVTQTEPAAALEALGQFRVLCAHRAGHRGVARLNQDIERWLEEDGAIDADALWYAGRPVLVTRNDRELDLYNGDVGIILGESAWFPGPEGLRELAPGALPDHDTVYATTVHKSQGSEYAHVLVVLPEVITPVVTRELLYTAVTRASERVTVIGSAEVIAEAVKRVIPRMSGLAARLRQ